MAAVKELIKAETDGTLSFGDYTLDKKTKLEGFEFQGNQYKVKTFSEITKLERDGMFVYESVPGTTVFDLIETDEGMEFSVEGKGNTQITVEMEPGREYRVFLDKETVGFMETNLGGKLSFSADLDSDKAVKVKIVKM